MGRSHRLVKLLCAVALAAGGALWLAVSTVAAGEDSITGVVRSASGAEAGVWVIAETDDLETLFRKIVVTNDDGRFLIPDLPEAAYTVWVRGYGLVDSVKAPAHAGDDLALEVVAATTPREAAEVYPANYWYSFVGDSGEGRVPRDGPVRERHQSEHADTSALDRSPEGLKDGCQLCHQMGQKATREVPNLADYDSTHDAWNKRVQIGGSGASMTSGLERMGRERAVQMYAGWTDRIMAGEVPEEPPRPSGVERNLVLTQWGWSTPRGFIHDEVATDKRNPMLYPNGKVYGVDMLGSLVVTDPIAHQSFQLEIPTRVPIVRRSAEYGAAVAEPVPSPYWGIDPSPRAGYSNPHNPMMDQKGRVWMTSTIRPGQNPDWCVDSEHPSVQQFPLRRASRHLSYYDTDSEKFVLIDTCYATHHLQFATDANDTLWTSGDTNVVGWLNTKMFDETGDERASQGWCPTVLDTNGDGTLGEYVEPNEPMDPTKDRRISGFAYGIIPHPSDGSIWIARRLPLPGHLVRLDPETCLSEVYEPPFEDPAVAFTQWGHGPRGIDVDRKGLIWVALAGSGHLASFDRSKCTVLNGPTATGKHCAEGWRLYPTPGPQMKGVDAAGSADFHYYLWVDQFDTLGLGAGVPIANGTTSDSLIALMPETDEMVVLRVPYPLGFYTRGLDGRIDDPDAGWKGRGLWASNDTIANWHNEGGKGMTSEIVRFQIRPHPLAE